MKQLSYLIFPFIFGCSAASSPTGSSTDASAAESNAALVGYNIESPVIEQQLPSILQEISGLTDLDTSHVACVQDEAGTVFVYNFKTGKIVSQHDFGGNGDYEGITYTGKDLFILQSDGLLIEWSDFKTPRASIKKHSLALQSADNEGLCYDAPNKRLLISAKSKSEGQEKQERAIYAFDLATRKLSDKLAYTLNAEGLEIPDSGKSKKKDKGKSKSGKNNGIQPSGLAVHPINDNLYILSSAEKMLVVVNRSGAIIQTQALPAKRFSQPEGLTFLPDGRMIIANEGGNKEATLLVYEMNKNGAR